VSGLVGALLFATGVGFVWFGSLTDLPGRAARRLRGATGAAVSELVVRIGLPALVLAPVCGLLAWDLLKVPALALLGASGGAYAPVVFRRSRVERQRREREQAWPSALDQLADGLEAGLAFPAAAMFVAQSGPSPLRRDFARFYRSIREGELETALDELARAPERAAVSAAAILRAAFVDVPTGGVAPVLRELARVLRERWETRERARSRALSLRREAAILAVSPLPFVLLIGASSPGYLSAYRSTAGTLVSLLGALVIVGCYLAMRRLGRIPEPGGKPEKR
jgi:tight adherence protein B